MRQPIYTLAILCALAFSAVAQGQQNTQAIYKWLLHQQQEHGILGNQEDDNFAGLYPNALAAICFIHEGDTARAERIFAFYESHRQREFSADTPGGFPQFANAATGELDRTADRWIGDNAWLLIALNYHRHATGNDAYPALRDALEGWLLSLQDDNGAVRAGFNKAGPMDHYSTEGNLDCYAALIDHPQARESVRKWLVSEMYVQDGQYFMMGSTVSEPAMDTCAWAISALGPQWGNTLANAEQTFLVTDTSDANGQPVRGFGDLLGKNRVWLEGTGEMAVAYRVVGDDDKAVQLLEELDKAAVQVDGDPDLVGIPCSTSDPAWTGASTLPFVPSNAWYLLGAWGFNPMNLE